MSVKLDKFSILKAELDGHLLVANIAVGLDTYEHKGETPWFLSISVPLLSPSDEGFPGPEEASQLNLLEEKIEAELRSTCTVVFVGRVTWSANREILFYLDNPDKAAEVLNALEGRERHSFAFQCVEDETWSELRVYSRAGTVQ
jgi:hypothetical protein